MMPLLLHHLFLFFLIINFSIEGSYSARIPCDTIDDCSHLDGKDVKCIKEGEASFCQCNGTKECSEKQMQVVSKIGEKCQLHEECNIQSSGCLDAKCTCINGTVASTDARQCFLMSSGIGGSCEDSVQCYSKIAYSGCIANKCVCQQGMHEFNGSCYKNIELGQTCNTLAECSLTENSDCINETCRCVEKYVRSPSTNKCLMTAEKYGSQCVDDIQCTKLLGGGSQCLAGYCKCRELYQLKEATSQCVRDMLLGEMCKVHVDCHGIEEGRSRLMCVEGECKCRPSYVEEYGNCISSSCPRELSVVVIVVLGLFNIIF